MSIAPNDSLPAAPGFAEDASEVMPQPGDEVMPGSGDTADTLVDDGAGAAASAADDTESEDAASSPLEQELATARSEIERLTAEFRQGKAELQRIYSQRLTMADGRAEVAEAQLDTALKTLAQIIEQNQLDPRLVDVVENQLNKTERQVGEQRRQTGQAYQESRQELQRAFQQDVRMQSRDADGNVLFDENDADIVTQYNRAMAFVGRHYAEEGGQPGTPMEAAATREFARLKQLIAHKREEGIRRAVDATKVKNASRQLQTRARAEARGPQATGSSSGSAPRTFKDYYEQAQAAAGGQLDETDIYAKALAQFNDARHAAT